MGFHSEKQLRSCLLPLQAASVRPAGLRQSPLHLLSLVQHVCCPVSVLLIYLPCEILNISPQLPFSKVWGGSGTKNAPTSGGILEVSVEDRGEDEGGPREHTDPYFPNSSCIPRVLMAVISSQA